MAGIKPASAGNTRRSRPSGSKPTGIKPASAGNTLREWRDPNTQSIEANDNPYVRRISTTHLGLTDPPLG